MEGSAGALFRTRTDTRNGTSIQPGSDQDGGPPMRTIPVGKRVRFTVQVQAFASPYGVIELHDPVRNPQYPYRVRPDGGEQVMWCSPREIEAEWKATVRGQALIFACLTAMVVNALYLVIGILRQWPALLFLAGVAG